MSREMQDELETIEREIYAIVGHEFNIGSPQQLSQVLFDEIGPAEDAQDEARLHDGRRSRWNSCAAPIRSST